MPSFEKAWRESFRRRHAAAKQMQQLDGMMFDDGEAWGEYSESTMKDWLRGTTSKILVAPQQ
jgi:hypothetical protein